MKSYDLQNMALTRDDKYLIALGRQNKVVRLEDNLVVAHISALSNTIRVAISPNGRFLGLGNTMGQSALYEINDGVFTLVYKKPRGQYPVSCFFTNDNLHLFAINQNTVWMIDTEKRDNKKIVDLPQLDFIIAYSEHKGKIILLVEHRINPAALYNTIHLLDALTGEMIATYTVDCIEGKDLFDVRFLSEEDVMLFYQRRYPQTRDLYTEIVLSRISGNQFEACKSQSIDDGVLMPGDYSFSLDNKYVAMTGMALDDRCESPYFFKTVAYDMSTFDKVFESTYQHGFGSGRVSFSASGNYLLIPAKESMIVPVSSFSKENITFHGASSVKRSTRTSSMDKMLEDFYDSLMDAAQSVLTKDQNH